MPEIDLPTAYAIISVVGGLLLIEWIIRQARKN